MTDKRIRIILDPTQAKKAAKDIDSSVKKIGDTADRSAFSVNKLAAAIAGVISVQKVVEYADAWTRVQNQLRQTTNSQNELAKSTSRIFQIAVETRANLEETANLYTRFRNAIDEAILSDERLFKITETINKSLAISGATAQESAGALRQLSQAIASGVLRGEEFNSIAEQAPSILKAVQVETGKTVGELRKLAADGFITTELLIKSLENYASTVDNQFSKSIATFGQKLEVARTQTIAFVGANETIAGAVDLAGSSIVTLSENLELLLEIAGAGAALYVARLIPSAIAYTQAIVASTAAQVASRPAVTGLSAALGVQAGALTAARIQANLMTVASSALRGALAFLGGPAGVVFLAASALIYFGSKTKETINPTDILTESIEGLTEAQKDLIKLNINKSFDEQVEIIEDASKKIKFLQDTLTRGTVTSKEGIKAANDELIIQKARLDEARIAAEKLTQKLAQLVAPKPEKPTGTTPSIVESETDQQAIDRLLKQEGELFRNFEDEINAAKSVTQNLKMELETRLKVAQFYREANLKGVEDSFERERAILYAQEQEQIALIDQRASEDAQRREDQLRKALEHEGFTEEQIRLLKEQYRLQELEATAVYEAQKTAIQEEAAARRAEIERLQWEASYQMAIGMGELILSASQGQSKRAFEFGKKVALASAAIDGTKSAISAWRSGMETPGPWAPAVAAAYTASSLLKTSSLINQIRGASFSGGGGGLGGSGGGFSTGVGGGASLPTTNGSQETFQQKKVIEIRGIDKDSLITGEQLTNILQSDDNVIVALSNAQTEAQRRGVI